MALLEPALRAELDALSRVLGRKARSRAPGEVLARSRGGTGEFFGHRSYAAGDDLRRIDWRAYARSGQPVLKVFRTEEEILLRIAIDCSGSLAAHFPYVKKLAVALGYLALRSGQRVQELSGATVLDKVSPVVRGDRGFLELQARTEALVAHGTTNLDAVLEGARARLKKPGVLVIFSDFLDEPLFERQVRHARTEGHEVWLIQLEESANALTQLRGDVCLVDAESGETLDITLDDNAWDAYLATRDATAQFLAQLAVRNGGQYQRVTIGAHVPAVLAALFGATGEATTANAAHLNIAARAR